ncbi:Rpn family recombination-promoting nuclease/putative transposase [Orientia tsutsugamushi]|uniref:Transposase and inactivated derivative n=1 Tax=Orientia tsutsugamushi (strain Boryong) TaxID=357244 RepID=A5CD43_ORITB|nr:Rpn family recombination-promoting nuclease/putative transposase [Orientia tsutsugamushi]CAM79696.1 transposase and inactivated derivative [Orientia tsutsugamushi str. Boryong]CAM80145.1 transposase and inactivated derivative [Orientia tsutsugamushi str. Boryong]CAM80523.1 transposase and inactivated derivative [Orientia tsutsugamushi str. Boryong]CAM80606.1 transposase and inactivated derivative [Orientia tsutsugamushi str. Boryong]CAM80834.1 transposase and inactivated derivative [Orienti
MTKKLKHDSLAKTIMSDPVAAQEFLEYYLPSDFKSLIDLSKIKVEQESYIEESLKKYSDIVYKVATKKHGNAFIYILIEAQSTVDYWTALRLWRYTLLLCERHKKEKTKLPLVYNLVIYNGKEVYNAPRNLWDLFTDSMIAKQLMTSDYQLVDLQSMSNDEIIRKKHIGMLEYMLKHIHQRDMLKLWQEFLINFKHVLILDKEKGYVYLRSFLWYTDTKLLENQQPELEQILAKYLSEEEKGNIMRTIAAKYIDEGIAKGRAEAAQGLARNLLKAGFSVEFIAENTGLSNEEVVNLKVSMDNS